MATLMGVKAVGDFAQVILGTGITLLIAGEEWRLY